MPRYVEHRDRDRDRDTFMNVFVARMLCAYLSYKMCNIR